MINCHKLKDKKTLVFWGQKCGATRLKEMLIHIESDSFFSNGGNDDITHKIYQRYYKTNSNELNETQNLQDYNILFFGRNPFHRIVSLYIDKYVAENSPTPNIGYNTSNFKSFIEGLCELKFSSKTSQQTIFSGFFPLNYGSQPADILFERVVKEYGSSVQYFSLKEFFLPDGKLLHDPIAVQALYKNSKCNPTHIQDTLDRDWNNKLAKIEKENIKPTIASQTIKLEETSINELRSLLKTHYIQVSDFFSHKLTETFINLFQSEFDLYESLGITYKKN